LFILLVLILSGTGASVAADPFLKVVNQTAEDYRTKAESLAQWCEKNGLMEEARTTRNQLLPSAVDKIYFPTFPKSIVSTNPPENASELVKKWTADWWKIRKDYAKKLQEMLGKAVRQNRGVLAMQMTLAALHADPNNETLRNIVGLKNHKNQWRTVWEIRKLKQGYVNHETFGWILEKHVSRYENGERFYQGKWITAVREQEIRSDLKVGWKIESEHYTIVTNHSLEAGVQLSRDLEDFYRAWRQLFIRFYASSDEFSAIFQGHPSEKTPHLKVVYYRNQDDYIKDNGDDPQIEMTGGFFDLEKECCFFFKSDNIEVQRTVYHEATHQLFTCSLNQPALSSGKWNFWVTEAIAVYMESYHKENGYYVLGGNDQERLKMAVYRAFETEFYVPFENLVQLDIVKFQRFPRLGIGLPEDWTLSMLYSQVGGMGHFFMHAAEGKYREVLVEYLRDVYMGYDTSDTLFELAQTSPQALDKEYVEYLADICKKGK